MSVVPGSSMKSGCPIHITVMDLFITFSFLIKFDCVCSTYKKASCGLRGVTMSSLSTNCFSCGLLFIIWFHSHSHISWTRNPKVVSLLILALVSSRTSYMVLFRWRECLMVRFGKHLRHPWKKHPWNSYTVRVFFFVPIHEKFASSMC